MLSTEAQNLLAWFQAFHITPTDYSNRNLTYPKTVRHGIFASALAELIAYEVANGPFEV